MPNFNKIIIIFTSHYRLTFKKLSFISSEFIAHIWIRLFEAFPLQQSSIILTCHFAANIVSVEKFLTFIVENIIILIHYLLKSHHSSFTKSIEIFNKNIIIRNRKSITIRNYSFNYFITLNFCISKYTTKSNPFKISTSI